MDVTRFRVRPGQRVSLRRYDPADTRPFKNKKKAAEHLERRLDRLCALQEQLYAEDTWSLLIVFQAMDAAGKDSAIKRVMSGLNPQGTQVFAFKRPSEEEIDHDFLWRTVKALPERGRIGIFNRSYYEEVLVVKVHPEILERQKLPRPVMTRALWNERYEDINAFERHMARSGTRILKFFLHVSKEEQRRRLLERLDEPSKNWKFQIGDLGEREHWADYRRAYEQALSRTSTAEAPWYIIPADSKWFTRAAIAEVVVQSLESLGLAMPKPSPAQLKEIAEGRRLLGEK